MKKKRRRRWPLLGSSMKLVQKLVLYMQSIAWRISKRSTKNVYPEAAGLDLAKNSSTSLNFFWRICEFAIIPLIILKYALQEGEEVEHNAVHVGTSRKCSVQHGTKRSGWSIAEKSNLSGQLPKSKRMANLFGGIRQEKDKVDYC